MATFTGADKAIGFLFDMVANIAADYDPAAIYSTNDYSVYNGVLYKCTTAITTPEDFNPAHWSAILIMDEIAAGGGGGGSTTLAGLSDVALSSLTNGDVLTYDSSISKWKNAAGGSSGGGHTWSRSEHAVGVWLDGKTVYEKTLHYDFDNATGNRTINIPHNVSNMETVVAFFGIINHSTVIPYGETFPSKSTEWNRCSVNSTNIAIGITGGWVGYTLELTIQYTKT